MDGTWERLFRSRVEGKDLTRLLFVEVFSGSGRLTASVRRVGLTESVGVDHVIAKQCAAPTVKLDLTKQCELLFKILDSPFTAAVHCGPPCGTASRAREIVRSGPCLKPLRSDVYPDGCPWIYGTDATKVAAANALYSLTADIADLCSRRGILFTVENPARSLFWETSLWLRTQPLQLHATFLHHCMFGSSRRKFTQLQANFAEISELGVLCNNQHGHRPWGCIPNKGWATAEETAYPWPLCAAFAHLIKNVLLEHGALEPAASLTQAQDSVYFAQIRQARAMTGVQPRGRRFPPLISEFKHIFTLVGPRHLIPTQFSNDWTVPHGVTCSSSVGIVPAGSKVIRTQWQGGIIRPAGSRADLDTKSDVDRLFKAVVGVFWTPDEFLTKASSIAHPRCLMAGLPESLKAAIRANVFASDEDLGRERTAVLRRWLSLAFKLRDEEQTMRAAMPAHGESITRGKRLALFRELLREINHLDALLTDQICKGYNLTGPIPASGVFKTKFTFAEMSVEELRATAELRSRGILASVKSSGDTSLDEELHKITLQELEKGWLEGPVSPEALPRGATVSRRFGIWQGGKCRPIDNLTESLINSTCSSCEGISVHTADVIGAALGFRMDLGRRAGISENLKAQCWDLRKAYKQLFVSASSLCDSYIGVWNPSTGVPEIYLQLVLPFGACASVNGFIRAATGLWGLGTVQLKLHWSGYYDDFFAVSRARCSDHTQLVVASFFRLLGWDISDDKLVAFSTVAKVLGLEVDLGDSHLFACSLKNTQKRISELSESIAGILLQGAHAPGELASLRGRLQFAETQMAGRQSCRAMGVLNYFVSRFPRGGHLHEKLKLALTFLRDRVVLAKPRLIVPATCETLVVFVDACHDDGKAGLGAVLVASEDQRGSFFSRWLAESELSLLNLAGSANPIFELESCAIAVALQTWSKYFINRQVVVYTDNNGTLGCFVKGQSDSECGRLLIEWTESWERANNARLWFERVPSHSNPADAPSRGCRDLGTTLSETEAELGEVLSAIRQSGKSGMGVTVAVR